MGDAMIELADMLCELRAELDRARSAADGETLRFELGPIDLELAVALEVTGGAAAKVRFWVVDLGADARTSSTSTQRIKLTLNPTITGESAAADVGAGRPPFVSSAATPNGR
jgi:Trypsin-co-occurring domain 2